MRKSRGVNRTRKTRRASPNSLIWIVLDSCRYDTFMAAQKPHITAFCKANGVAVDRRYSYASWTAPAHCVFLMGITPHSNPTHVLASEVYRQEFRQWEERLGVKNLDYLQFIPSLSLPKVLKGLGYRTMARVSLPVLNEATSFSAHFDDYRLMDDHNDFAGMIDEIELHADSPTFCFLNLGETHYPYMLDDKSLPRISGVHGVCSSIRTKRSRNTESSAEFLGARVMSRLHRQQIRCVEYVDSLLPRLFAKCPARTHVIITADHGELFGEDGFFGHGPIVHGKVFEVPFTEGTVGGS